MDIKPIRTKANYRAALRAVESLMTVKANTPDGDRLDVLTTLVEAYERAHFPMDLPDAVDAIKFRMEQSGLMAKDLEPVIGRKNRVYEILSRSTAFQRHLASRPDAGDLIQGTGGLRKVRWALGGSDKRGGVRVIYSTSLHGHRCACC